MATLVINTDDIPGGSLTQRSAWWAMSVFELLTKSGQMRDAIPDNAVFVVLPSSDLELCDYNLSLSMKRPGTKVYVEISEVDAGYKVIPHLPVDLDVDKTYA